MVVWWALSEVTLPLMARQFWGATATALRHDHFSRLAVHLFNSRTKKNWSAVALTGHHTGAKAILPLVAVEQLICWPFLSVCWRRSATLA